MTELLLTEKLRRTDEVIKQALEEKKQLVAEILHVPKEEFENIAELAAEPSKDKEASEIVLAAVSQGTCSALLPGREEQRPQGR